MFDNILLPTDGSESSKKAIKATIAFAKKNGSRVIGLSVEENHPYFPYADLEDATSVAKANVRKIQELAANSNVPCNVYTEKGSSVHEEILQSAARHGCDAIFIGSHGHKGLDRLLLGSVAQKVLIDSPIPVVVFK